ncbi:MAG: alpha/beta fold hydrolase [Chloroflexi bacterium]|jgi:dipeptidyl aminopeptidase/acylaminoacyl peptidase|nr:alpha/beta fold hydrolase [Chloroflexota bacterium]
MKRLVVIVLVAVALWLAIADFALPAARSWDDGSPDAGQAALQVATPTPAPSATPDDPYAGLTVEDLSARFYGAGELKIEQTMETNQAFTRYLISYPSDDLTIYGFMNVPPGEGPFPVIVALHGYINPAAYATLDYTTHYADDLARAGYLVLHPNLRGYWPSDSGPDRFRVGMAIDVLNLIGLVVQQGGLAGPLVQANPDAIGLWGHSMGGGISLRALTISPHVDAAVLYGAMGGDERQNYTKILEWSGGASGREELSTSDDDLQRISPIYFLDRVQAAVSIHHGALDATVPPAWSQDLCERLSALGKPVECFSYSDQPHTFYGEGDRLFKERTIKFFDAYLKGV